MRCKLFAVFLFLILSAPLWAWNKIGHELVAKIAYEHLTPETKKSVQNELNATRQKYHSASFVKVASWLDTLRYQKIHRYDALHFIDIPFSKDDSTLPDYSKSNLITGIEYASNILKSPYSSQFDKGIALRILIHIIGDAHQPLHTATYISHEHPQGDRGGNDYFIKAQPIAKNLHGFWDKGAGQFSDKKISLKRLAKNIENRYPCMKEDSISPITWIQQSHQIAEKFSYSLLEHARPSNDYQQKAMDLSEKQIALAGCRLAAMLNRIHT